MLDIKLITENPDLVQERLAKKGCIVDFNDVLAWNNEKKKLIKMLFQIKLLLSLYM